MALTAGTRLGSYEIRGPIGAGGMGEVYRAHDGRLGRDVAIKVLPEAFATDEERLQRFEQEARATAALNHPNILAVYDVGRSGNTAYVVEELLDGRTLRALLADGAPASRKVVDYAIQVARGLAAAHEKGIVHRDLKPENLFITTDDRVKILDFGLAKYVSRRVDGGRTDGRRTDLQSAQQSPQQETALAGTEPGIVLGTAGYMSPEQVRGLAVDHRADIFSFGAVLYEMLAGRRAFAGDTAADTMTAILREAPPEPSAAGRTVPPGLERVVARCLEKSPALRFQSASDLAFALETISAGGSVPSGVRAPGEVPDEAGRRVGRRAAGTALAFAAGAAVGVYASVLWFRAPVVTSTGDVIRFKVSTADITGIDDITRVAVSPDGRYLALTEAGAGGRTLLAWSLTDGTRHDLGGIAAVGQPAWSPDSQWLAFYADGAMHRVNIDGTRRQRLATLDWSPSASTWAANGEIVVVVSLSGTVVAIPEAGGEPRVVLAPAEGDTAWTTVHAMPDGRSLLVGRGVGPDAEIVLAALDGSREPTVIGSGSYPQFVEPDHLVALQGNQLVVRTMDPGTGTVAGEATVLVDDVLVRQGSAVYPFSSSRTGVLAYRLESEELPTRLAWFDRSGREGAALRLQGHCRNPELSPDYGRVAVECYTSAGDRDVWVYDLARDAADRLTLDPADDADPLWEPNGRTILFGSSRLGPVDVFRTAVGGGGRADLAVATDAATPPMAISPDGRTLILLTAGPDLGRVEVEGSGEIVPLVATPFSDLEGQFSPDGRFFSYSSSQTGRNEIYVEPWPQTGERWTVSTDGGTDARWRHDSREIFYVAPDRGLLAVPVDASAGFRAGRPVALFQTRIAGPLGTGHRFPYAVSRDGQQFLMYVTEPNAPPPSITVMVNWPALLKR